MEQPNRGRKKRSPWWMVRVALFLALPAALACAFVAYLNSLSLPPSMRQPPAATLEAFDLERFESPEDEAVADASDFKPSDEQILAWNHDYENYVRFRIENGSGNEGAALYLTLLEASETGGFLDEFRAAFYSEPGQPQRPDASKSLSPEETTWLENNKSFIALALRVASEGDCLAPNRRELLAAGDAGVQHWPYQDFGPIHLCDRVLPAEAMRRHEAGLGLATAAEPLMAEYRLATIVHRDPRLVHLLSMTLDFTGRLLQRWIEKGEPLGDQTRADLLEAMGALEPAAWSAENDPFSLKMHYHWVRDSLVQALEVPWGDFLREYMSRRSFFDAVVLDFLHDARADTKRKAGAEACLREFDERWRVCAQALANDYATAAAFEPPPMREMGSGLEYDRWTPDVPHEAARRRLPLARLNLNRAALLWLSDERPPREKIEARQGSYSPWRDPFTDAPLRVVETTTCTLIYSLGPDRIDQGGAVLYDQIKGTLSAGDLVIHIPKKDPPSAGLGGSSP